MDAQRTLTSAGDLQDWFTDPDGWICRFTANVDVSRLQPKREHSVHKCRNCFQEPTTHINHITPQTSPVPPVTLHEIIVNGLLIAQKKDTRSKAAFLNIFKGNDDYTHFDYVLLTAVKENGRRYIQNYIRSKI